MVPAAFAVGGADGGDHVARDGTRVVARVEVAKLFPAFLLEEARSGQGGGQPFGGS